MQYAPVRPRERNQTTPRGLPQAAVAPHPGTDVLGRVFGIVLAVALFLGGLIIWQGRDGATTELPRVPSDEANTTALDVEVQRIVSDPGEPVDPPTPPIAPPTATIVANPRPGDLRTDPQADVLPVGYTPTPATTVVADLAYGPDEQQRLDLHLPDQPDPTTPVVVYLHSGGWIGGDKSGIPDMIRRFVERGYVLASINYSLAPEQPFPVPVQDLNRAIRWLKAYSETEGIFDGDRMVLAGASAGGHLAAFAAATAGDYDPPTLPLELQAHDTRVVGVVSFVGPTDLVQQYDQPHVWSRGITSAFAGCYPCTPAQLTESSVAPHLHPDLPPAYWIYGEDDPLVDADAQGAAIADEWARHVGARRSWLDVVDSGGHDLDESQVNIRSLDGFVDAVTGLG